ncbi:hypothetical protein QY97_03994 [Bacillus thermotolerans]|nr:hypothetical protein QY97_03994 [Bacillus thermotolerans]
MIKDSQKAKTLPVIGLNLFLHSAFPALSDKYAIIKWSF